MGRPGEGRDNNAAGFGEFELIARLFAPLSDAAHGFQLTDDVGLVPDTDNRVCVTSDMIVAGVHFLPDDPPDTIARKLVRVNVSDIAAKGAQVSGLQLSAAFNRDRDVSWIEAFASGLADDLALFGAPLIGGDTVRTPGPDSFSLTAFGKVGPHGLVRRTGAQPGDGLYVTGTIGDAALGLKILKGELGMVPLGRRQPLVERYRVPTPRHAFGAGLGAFASSALDVSDGLLADAGHLATVSGVSLDVSFDRVPLSGSAARLVKGNADLHLSLMGAGDDYEILFTTSTDNSDVLAELAGASDTPVTRIGHVGKVPAGTVTLRDSAGDVLTVPSRGFRHF